MWETVDAGEKEQQLAWPSVVEHLRRVTSPAPVIVIHFLGFEPLALPWQFPVRIGQKRNLL
jgi:hypothetical protein